MTPTPRARRARLVATLAAAAGALAFATRLGRRFEIAGGSMLPTLEPGDRVLAVRWPVARPGDLVALRDPRDPARLIVKRVEAIDADGYRVAGDNPDASTDSASFGTVPRRDIVGRVVYRYEPPERVGRLPRSGPDLRG